MQSPTLVSTIAPPPSQFPRSQLAAELTEKVSSLEMGHMMVQHPPKNTKAVQIGFQMADSVQSLMILPVSSQARPVLHRSVALDQNILLR